MSKRTVFTTITPLPVGITREVVVDFLHNHLEMIDLNPLVKERHPIKPPPHATPEEFHCIWYSLTDKISYLPGGLATGDVSYTCAFHDLPIGLQTHCYAPMGLDIKDKWTLGGSLPGEPVEAVELGIGAPLTGLYIREDVDMRCNVFMAGFVKKTLKKAHGMLVDRLKVKAQIATAANLNHRMSISHSVRSSVGGNWQSNSPPVLQGSFPPSARSSTSLPQQYGQFDFQFSQPQGMRVSPVQQLAVPAAYNSSREYDDLPSAYPNSAFPEPLRPGPFSIRDSQGRVTWQALKQTPSINSRHSMISGQDYSDIAQMNPYGDTKGAFANRTSEDYQRYQNPHQNGAEHKLSYAPEQRRQNPQFVAELE